MSFLNVLLLTAVSVLISCSSMTKEECQNTNWRQMGKNDALRGGVLADLTDDQRECAELGVPMNDTQYKQGFDEGLVTFCTYPSGREFGSQGKSYLGNCPQKVEQKFLKGFYEGKKLWEAAEKERELRERERVLIEREAALNAAARSTMFSGRKCTFDSDCDIEFSCDFSKCKGSGRTCSFDSDCKVEGDCATVTTTSTGKGTYTEQRCTYN